MRPLLTTRKSSFIKFIGTVSLILTLFVSCNDQNQDGSTTTGTTDRTQQPAGVTVQGIKEFPYLKLTRTDLLNYFYEDTNPQRPRYKKLLLSYTIDNYASVPSNSLNLLAQGAKPPHDSLLAGVAVKLTVDETHNSPLDTDNLRYSTLELSEKRIRSLVEARPNVWKEFEYLVFIPYPHTHAGQTHLSYHVQLRPLPAGAAADQIDANPCPPFRPNEE